MDVEMLLGCTVQDCDHNIGCVCRNVKGVEINQYGLCSLSPMTAAMSKTPKAKEDLQNDTQQLKDSILLLRDNYKQCECAQDLYELIERAIATAKLESI